MENITSVLLALFGYTLFSTGNVLQKKGVSWLNWKGAKDKKYAANLLIWGLGILLSYVVSIIPNGMASINLPPHIVSAISGWGITAIIILSYFLLKEKLYKSDILYSIVIIGAIFIIGIFQKASPIYKVNRYALYLLVFLPFLLLIPALLKHTGNKIKTVCFSIFGGIGGGLTIVILNIAVKEYGASAAGYITSPYLFMYGLIGITTAIVMQLAYKYGQMVLIAPLQVSFNIIYPIICSYFIFNTPVGILQIGAIMLIVLSCYMILKKH